jgi:hypothetical protein
MSKPNCWEFMKCGRQPRGERVATLGVCPAATEKKLDGTHHGKNAGRACWAVAGTLCEGSRGLKKTTGAGSEFYVKVRDEIPELRARAKQSSVHKLVSVLLAPTLLSG